MGKAKVYGLGFSVREKQRARNSRASHGIIKCLWRSLKYWIGISKYSSWHNLSSSLVPEKPNDWGLCGSSIFGICAWCRLWPEMPLTYFCFLSVARDLLRTISIVYIPDGLGLGDTELRVFLPWVPSVRHRRPFYPQDFGAFALGFFRELKPHAPQNPQVIQAAPMKSLKTSRACIEPYKTW